MKIKINYLFCIQLIIIVTILSQIDLFTNILHLIMYAFWLGLLTLGIFIKNRKISIDNNQKVYLYCFLAYLLLCMLLSIVKHESYLSGYYLRAITIPLLVILSTRNYILFFTYQDLLIIFKTYVLTALIHGIYIIIRFMPSYSTWLQSTYYFFASKNSAAQIWMSATILSFFLAKMSNKKIWYPISIFFVVISALCRCRTAILGIVLSGFCYVFLYSKRKIYWVLFLVVLTTILIRSPNVMVFIDRSLLLSKYSKQGLNSFSSNRVYLYMEALNTIDKNLLFGTGKYYVDCSYLMILSETGIIGFIIIETIWISRVLFNLSWRSEYKNHVLKDIIITLSVFYCVESVLEGLPPFGPGASSFMFWLLCGLIVDTKNY